MSERTIDSGSRPSVGALLQRAARAERRRVLAWLIATAVAAAATFAVGVTEVAVVVAAIGVALASWAARQVAGIHLARRDFERADTPPRRAYVALLHDPNPRAVRPLLAVWSQRPPSGERLPKPESVWRCDDELDDLESHQGSVVLHEAWIDTGPRSWSKPRWVRADGGIALPHRRALLGRWYVRTTLRSDRPDEAQELTIEHPHAASGMPGELPLDGGLLGSVLGRIAFLGILAALFVVLG